MHRKHKCFICGKPHPMWQCNQNKLFNKNKTTPRKPRTGKAFKAKTAVKGAK